MKRFSERQERVFKSLTKLITYHKSDDPREILNELFEYRTSPVRYEVDIYNDFSWLSDDEWFAVRDRIEEEYSILLK